ncbi:MAG: DinB family protein [Phycisphaerae bacterium]|nr:DinB family protein [Phycisphaerae bacterium]NUQ44933.1 DinB family protein [Phycisphaerae bacterium]
MTCKELLLSELSASQWLFENFTKDFTDDEARFQPFDGGNHVIWLIAHVAVTEDWAVNLLGGGPKRLPEPIHQAFGGGRPCRTDTSLTLKEAWDMLKRTRKHTEEFIRAMPESRLDEKSPQGAPPQFPTVGAFLGLIGTHPFWHFGQLSVNRRMLKKPAVFDVQ